MVHHGLSWALASPHGLVLLKILDTQDMITEICQIF